MAALPSDIGPAKRVAQIVTVADSAVQTKFPTARDGLKSPATGYFDSASDAATALAARAVLIGAVRRRFAVQVADMVLPNLSAGVPCWTLIDAEQGVNGVFLLARLEIDFENETTGMELFG